MINDIQNSVAQSAAEEFLHNISLMSQKILLADNAQQWIFRGLAFFEKHHDWQGNEDDEVLSEKRLDFVEHFLRESRPGLKPLKRSTLERYVGAELANLRKRDERRTQ